VRALAKLTALAALCAALYAPASAQGFGFTGLDAGLLEEDGSPATEAGSHPFSFSTTIGFETELDPDLGFEVPAGSAKDLVVSAPIGLAANPTATPRCETLDFLKISTSTGSCPAASQIGVTDVTYSDPDNTERFAVYNLVPPPGVAAKLGFVVTPVPVTIEGGVNPNPPYNILATLDNVAQVLPFYSATTHIFSETGGRPFLTAPRACTGPLQTAFEASSWQDPDTEIHEEVEVEGMAFCDKLGFAPRISNQPTSRAADAATGLEFELRIDDAGYERPEVSADSDIKKAEVTLPEGMTANPAVAEGLEACSPGQYEDESLERGGGCPPASKVATVQTETPLLEGETIAGDVFIAEPFENPFDTLLALYMVIRDRELGVLVKLAGKVEPDPVTGQLTTTFGEPGHELPQLPVSRFSFRFREGARGPLITPGRCDADPSTPVRDPYVTKAVFTPWANPSEPRVETAAFEIDQGPGGAPCPVGGQPFSPGFEAGSLNPAAGRHSPFLMRLTRRDGDQDLVRFDASLPPGVTAKLAGVAQCPDAGIAAAKAKSGKEELAAPSCPPSSRIGSAIGGAGVGSQLAYVHGSVYLAGPFGGAPLSAVGIVPAVAGPFDVGTVVVRQALRVDPRSAAVTADGALSDPIPHILAGIPLRVRDVRVNVDRPDFTLNPTSCAPKTIGAGIWGGGQDPFATADDAPAILAEPFQAADCGALGFRPRLGIRLKGPARRGGHPALRAAYVPRPGDANLQDMALTFPRSAFVENANFRTICTRVQYAANACPKDSIYGQVKAWTPLLDEPLQGPVYLRSSDNLLPDAVFDLEGLIDAEASVRIDSVKGRLRATVEEAPDVPVSRVVVQMQGGSKGLFVNSANICAGANRGKALATAHSNRRATLKPRFRAAGCGGKGKAKGSRRG
jgi:hypothetical protein